jgi:hypothetical protein
MEKRVIDLEIIDDAENSGVSAIALVDVPAIERDWMAFRYEEFVEPSKGESEEEYIPRCIAYNVNEGKDPDQAAAICYSMWQNHEVTFDIDPNPCWEGYEPYGLKDDGTPNCIPIKNRKEEFAAETYTDYPEGAVNNAKRALAWAEKNGWGDCGMGAGKARANQLANREAISEDTIARMSAFERHRQNSDTPYSEGCGKLMWDAWGGDAGIRWAHNKLREIRGGDFSYDVSALPPYIDEVPRKKEKMTKQYFASEDQQIVVGPAMIPDMEIMRKDKKTKLPYYVRFSKEVIQKIAEKFMRELRNHDTNVQHVAKDDAKTYVMETWLVENEEDKANTHYNFNVPVGTWMVKMRVTDPAIWKQIKSGELKGFSIEGNFMEREDYIAYQKDKELYNRVIKILKSV